MLSVVIPVYNEGAVLEKTASVIRGVLSDAAIGCELIFVDDGSKDATWEKITALSASGGIRGLHFSRNFGKEAAILAGLAAAKGDCCVVIDGDLQHPPEKIVEMYRLWEQGFVPHDESTMGVTPETQEQMIKMMLTEEDQLEDVTIKQWFSPAFFQSQFGTTGAPCWHSSPTTA